MKRSFGNGPGDLGSIPGRVIPKTQKMVLDASLLNTQHYKVRIKGKVEQSREGVAPSPTPWCSSYRKGSLRVTLDYCRQLKLSTFQILTKFLQNLLIMVFPANSRKAMEAYHFFLSTDTNITMKKPVHQRTKKRTCTEVRYKINWEKEREREREVGVCNFSSCCR